VCVGGWGGGWGGVCECREAGGEGWCAKGREK